MNSSQFYSDFLIIGSGIAGLAFAINVSQYGSVNIVTKKKDSDSNTNYAQGGIAVVLSPDDSIEDHIKDTLEVGANLCNRRAVEILVSNGPDRVRELINWGTRFSSRTDTVGHKILDLGKEGGHSCNRIAHASDLTGQEIERALLNKISTIDNIKIFENSTAIDLLTEHQLRYLSSQERSFNGTDSITCYGAYILDNSTGVVNIFNSKITFLATGGVGQVYRHTTNPDIATGDGIAMAYRAGALIADMEFIQFHPTTLYEEKQDERSFLISEAVRGEGGILINSRGHRFMEHEHPMKDLAPRDIVARAIDRELKTLGDKFVLLDISFKDKDFLTQRFPQIYEQCLEKGYDITQEPIPVVPAAHYLCGGIISDLFGRTAIRNLYVSGESSCTGVHGANRLASNSLLEGVVFSHRAYEHICSSIDSIRKIAIPEYPHWNKEGTFDLEEWILIQHNVEGVQRLMWDYVGIVRSNLRLQRAFRRILLLDEEIQDFYRRSTISSRLVELRNLATIAKLIIQGAMSRKESRGLHYNTDYPFTIDNQKRHVILQSGMEPYMRDLEELSFS